MPIEIPSLNLAALAPPLIVIVTALLLLLFDLGVSDKRILGYLALLGVALAFGVSITMVPHNFIFVLIAFIIYFAYQVY